MTELLEDIAVLENLVIAMNEGASDEKYMALHAVETLLLKKKDALLNLNLTWKRSLQMIRQKLQREFVIDLTGPRG